MKINKRSTQTRGRMAAGFTLLEMVIVLGIIALILGAAISFSGGITEAARIQAAEAKSREFSAKLETYRMLAGVYPSETQGLQALVEKPTSAPEPKRWKAQFKALPKRLKDKMPKAVLDFFEEIPYNFDLSWMEEDK